ncbi:MAG: hypothetical protein LBE18_00905 [Planctomycetaceae bacterium]|nr:hypothetical protein [Planctomycetaceae bacterium]
MDTIYAEGQRRYVESLSSYARQFIGQLQKPHVERIEGLSPAIAIEQKAVSHSPRSTVGTITEIQDYLRVLFARLGVSYCPDCNIPVGTQTLDEIIAKIMSNPVTGKLMIAAPINIEVGQIYEELWKRLRSEGFSRVRVDGVLYSLEVNEKSLLNERGLLNEKGLPDIDRRRHHNIELVIDRIVLRDDQSSRMRIADSVENALSIGQGVVHVIEVDENKPETKWQRSIHSQHLACENCGRSFERLTPHHFSSNSPLGWCPNCEGLGIQRGANPAVFLQDPKLTIAEGVVKLLPDSKTVIGNAMLKVFSEQTGIPLNVPFEQLDARLKRIIYHGAGDQEFNVKFEINSSNSNKELANESSSNDYSSNDSQTKDSLSNDSQTKGFLTKELSLKVQSKGSANSTKKVISGVKSSGVKSSSEKSSGEKSSGVKSSGEKSSGVNNEISLLETVEFSFQYKGLYAAVDEASRLVPSFRVMEDMVLDEVECGVCMGSKLRDDVSAVRLFGYTMDQICRFPLGKLAEIIRGWKLSEVEQQVASDLLVEITNRLQFLIDVGLDYLTLSRSAPTLSGGEMQRIRLAAQIGSGLVGVLYVLDEPTIGLHPRDNRKLIEALKKLRDLGNTLVIVEHDKDVIMGADKILDFGPQAGKFGGEIVAQGNPEQIMKQKSSVTGAYLSGQKQIPIPKNRRILISQAKKCPTRIKNI